MSIDFHNILKHRRDKLINDIHSEKDPQITVDRTFLEKALQNVEQVQILLLQKRRDREGGSLPPNRIEKELQSIQENIARAFYEEGDWPIEYFDTEEEEA